MKFEPIIESDDPQLSREVVQALESIDDPELHVDIYTLELIRALTIKSGSIHVLMTLTTPFCPYGPQLIDEVKGTVGALAGVSDVELELTFEKRWEPSSDLKALLGIPL
jgi:metal-sulfur cluster biosynthetic enzyme